MRLLIFFTPQPGTTVGDLDSQLGCTLDDLLSLLARDVVCDLSGKALVGHQEDLKFLLQEVK